MPPLFLDRNRRLHLPKAGATMCTYFWDITLGLHLHDLSITENNSIVRGESMDILNGNRRVLSVKLPFGWSNSIVRCWKGSRHHKFFKTRGREYEEIVIRNIARIT